MSVQNTEKNIIVGNNKMLSSSSGDKYTCPVCGSKIKNNPSNIKNHNATIKHQNAVNGVTPVKGTVSNDAKKIAERKRVAEYRAKKRSEIGEQDYKKAQKDYKQNYRNKTKIINEVSISEQSRGLSDAKKQLDEMKGVDDIPSIEKEKKIKLVLDAVELKADENQEAIINKIVKAGKGSVKAKTVKENLNRLFNIYKYIYTKLWDYVTFDWLKDVDMVYDQIGKKYKGMSEKTRSNQFASIAGILKFFPDYKKEKGLYSKLATGIVDKLDKVSKDNNLSNKQNEWLNWSEVEKVWSKIGDDNGGNTFIRALYAIYCFIPVRRVMDYQLMKIVRKDKMSDAKIKQLSKKFNYIFLDKNRTPISMTIWNYKEGPRRSWAKKNNNYGEYVLDPIPDKLSKVLHEYIIDENLNGNDFLFGLDNNHQKNYSENAFSSLVSNNLFQTFSGVHMTVNALRHSYASWFWDRLNSYNLKEAFSFRMGSSQNEIGKTYYKIQLTPKYNKK